MELIYLCCLIGIMFGLHGSEYHLQTELIAGVLQANTDGADYLIIVSDGEQLLYG